MPKTFDVSVTKIIRVTLDDPDRFDEGFWDQFNSTISDRGGPDFPYLIDHIAWNYVQGYDAFVEGVGELSEMGVTVQEIDSEVELQDAEV